MRICRDTVALYYCTFPEKKYNNSAVRCTCSNHNVAVLEDVLCMLTAQVNDWCNFLVELDVNLDSLLLRRERLSEQEQPQQYCACNYVLCSPVIRSVALTTCLQLHTLWYHMMITVI